MKTNHAPAPPGFTLVEIMIVVAIIGLLAAMAIPNLVDARLKAQRAACINNLRLISSAKEQWALEKGKAGSITPAAADLQPYLGNCASGQLPHCPLASDFDASYAPNELGVNPVCKLSPETHRLE